MPPIVREYFQAKSESPEKLREHFLYRFLHFRDNYSDELPERDVRELIGVDEHMTKYKCQGNYLVGLGVTLGTALEDGVFTSQAVYEQVESFLHHDFEFSHGRFTTREEIVLVNATLATVIQSLENDKDTSKETI